MHRVLVELVVDVPPDRLLQLDDEALDVGLIVGKKCQLVAYAPQHLGHCFLHFVHAAEDEVLGPVGVVLGEREQVLRMVEVVVRLPCRAPPCVHLVPSRAAIGPLRGRGVSQQQVVRAQVHVSRVHVELNLCFLGVRHRHQVPERYHSISHAQSAVSIRKPVGRIIPLAFQPKISARPTILLSSFLMAKKKGAKPISPAPVFIPCLANVRVVSTLLL